MDAEVLYITGEEVHAGDRVQHRGTFGTVVVVSAGEKSEFSPGYEDHAGADRGLLVCDDDGIVNSVHEADEYLSFIGRG